jgi:hypothetical protein
MSGAANSDDDVLRAAVELAAGDRARAQLWFETQGLEPFCGLTAAQLAQQGRSADVLAFLKSLEAGPVG